MDIGSLQVQSDGIFFFFELLFALPVCMQHDSGFLDEWGTIHVFNVRSIETALWIVDVYRFIVAGAGLFKSLFRVTGSCQ